MSAAGKQFIGLLPPSKERPPSNFWGQAGTHNIVRDQLTITTWLCIGAAAQTLLFLAVGRLALIPAAAVLIYRILVAYAMSVGWMHNIYMDGVVPSKTAAQFPDATGQYKSKAADQGIVVFLIGMRNNHPLGALAPGFKEFGGFFAEMVKELDAEPEKFDYLGMTSYINANERTTGSQLLNVGYFQSVEGLHQYAHSERHRRGWDWFKNNKKRYPHLSIYHETYHAPKGHWETIYENSHISGLHTTTQAYTDAVSGEKRWASPVVDASKGLLRSAAGRMSRSKGEEHEYFEK